MLFRRRKKLSLLERLRLFVWPQKSFVRSMRYLGKRVLRLNATPHAIAAGVAAGVIASWTPLIGFHFVLSFALAYVFAGNMIAAGIGTAFGNPLTFPFIWASTFKLGHIILDRGKQEVEHVSINLGDLLSRIDWTHLWQPILKPMLIGSIPPAVVSGVFFYGLTFYSVRAFQRRRKRVLAEKAEARASARSTAGAPL
jgi:uncharacterized protein